MAFHVVATSGGLKNREFDTYLEVLTHLGHSTDREQSRIPQPNGSVYLKCGMIGKVSRREEADAIKTELEHRLPYLSWVVEEVT